MYRCRKWLIIIGNLYYTPSILRCFSYTLGVGYNNRKEAMKGADFLVYLKDRCPRKILPHCTFIIWCYRQRLNVNDTHDKDLK